MSKNIMLNVHTRFMGVLLVVLMATLGCMVEIIENDDGSVDFEVSPICLFGDFEGDATYTVTSQSGEGEPFEVISTSRHVLSFGDDFKPVSSPIMLGLLSTANPEDLTDAPEIDFFEESGERSFSWVTQEAVGDSVRHVRTDANFEIADAEFTKTSFRIRFDFTGAQLFFDDESDDPENDADADSVFDLEGEYTLQGELMDAETLQYSSSTQQVASDRNFDFVDNINATGEGTFQLVVRQEF